MVHTYYDNEARAVMIGMPFLHPMEQVEWVKCARERVALFAAGAHEYPTLTRFLRQELQDPQLLVRLDLEHDCISIDKFVPDNACYFKLMNLVDEQGRGRRLVWGEERHLVKLLQKGNMRRPNYLKEHKAEVEAVKVSQAKKRDAIVLEAVDQLSTKSISQFIDVHRAMHTGETIVAHGSDLKSIETMAEVSKTAPMVPTGKAFNEGMHPLKYVRDPR